MHSRDTNCVDHFSAIFWRVLVLCQYFEMTQKRDEVLKFVQRCPSGQKQNMVSLEQKVLYITKKTNISNEKY